MYFPFRFTFEDFRKVRSFVISSTTVWLNNSKLKKNLSSPPSKSVWARSKMCSSSSGFHSPYAGSHSYCMLLYFHLSRPNICRFINHTSEYASILSPDVSVFIRWASIELAEVCPYGYSLWRCLWNKFYFILNVHLNTSAFTANTQVF